MRLAALLIEPGYTTSYKLYLQYFLLTRTLDAGGLCLQNGIPCPACCLMNHMIYTRYCPYRLLSPIPCGYMYLVFIYLKSYIYIYIPIYR
jgi:hypothetical protein